MNCVVILAVIAIWLLLLVAKLSLVCLVVGLYWLMFNRIVLDLHRLVTKGHIVGFQWDSLLGIHLLMSLVRNLLIILIIRCH